MKRVYNYISRVILKLFYDSKYFTGKYFESNSSMGYRYAWKFLIHQKVFGYNRNIPWPVSFQNQISNYENLIFDCNDMQNFWHYGCYFQNFNAKIYIGKGTYIAPNCGFITANHDKNDLDKHQEGKDIIIGKNCWIGMNSVILPGVILGDNTIVGAGSIVTHSFPEGNVTIGGNVARVINIGDENKNNDK